MIMQWRYTRIRSCMCVSVQAELSFLAHECFQLDKFRAETCCIVGNYYSLRGQHEQAIVYFRRALKANRRCVCGVTCGSLMLKLMLMWLGLQVFVCVDADGS